MAAGTSPETGAGTALQMGIVNAATTIERLLTEQEIVIVAINGGPCTGKSTRVCPEIARNFDSVQIISEDNYCLGNSWSAARYGTPNLQTPEAYNPERMIQDLAALRSGQTIDLPQLDFGRREPSPDSKKADPTNLVLVEGAYLLQPPVIDAFDLALFVDTSDHGRFIRRLLRPPRQPTQTNAARLREYCETAFPAYYTQTAPYRAEANAVIDNSYHPAEAAARLALVGAEVTLAPPMSVVQYTHPAMQAGEQLQLSTYKDGQQMVSYRPDDQETGQRLDVLTKVADYEIDLTKIGYSAH